MDSVNLTQQDLAANKAGDLSPKQMADLRRQRWVWISGTAGILLIVGGFTAVLLFNRFNPDTSDRGQLIILFALALFWLWLLRNQPGQWLRVNQDLKEGRVSQMTGTAETSLGMGVGIFRTVQYLVHLNDNRFRVSQDIYRQFKPGESYRLYHSPRAMFFLGALPVVQNLETVVRADTAVAQPLLDPLTDREAEILQLIAAGLSNKEIAAQLSLSTNTVKMYASQLYQKLDVSRRTEAVARARDIGLLDQ